jgi:hypothetical protein
MVGDSWRADVQGALGVGMRPILVRATHPSADVQCTTLFDVAALLKASCDSSSQ